VTATDGGALPNLVVIGAMKCGTTSLHSYLGAHPDIGMSEPKELNFFFGPDVADAAGGEEAWAVGNWHRGTGWYAAHFDPACRVRGESSPGYTSPSRPESAARMAAVVPTARLLYAVRDPVRRALSQYGHHRREGAETRALADALLDPASQYLSRGRYLERLAPFLDTGAFDGRITVVAQEELATDLPTAMRRVFADLDVDPDHWSPAMGTRRNAAPEPAPVLDPALQEALAEAFRDDAERLRAFAGREFPGWTV
jgi:Sulfotransferase family